MGCGRGDCPCRPAPLVDLYERWYQVLRGYRMESAGPALRELNHPAPTLGDVLREKYGLAPEND